MLIYQLGERVSGGFLGFYIAKGAHPLPIIVEQKNYGSRLGRKGERAGKGCGAFLQKLVFLEFDENIVRMSRTVEKS